MAALTQDRNTPRKVVERIVAEDAPVAASTTIWNGSIVCASATGELRPGADVAGLTFIGIAQSRMSNASTSAVKVRPAARAAVGIFKLDTTGANAITAADLGKSCYVLDDHTVVRQAGTSNAVLAGTVDSIDPDGGIWVKSANL